PDSITGRFLAHPLAHPLVAPRITGERSPAVAVSRPPRDNLNTVPERIPLERLTVITGVSGSGKSTLARDVLYANLLELVGNPRRRKSVELVGCTDLAGWEALERVLEVDQTPIGRTPRSCPGTYVGFWDAIRRLYA